MKILPFFAMAALTVATPVMAGDRPEPMPGQEKAVQLSLEQCPSGIERMLPGDYYFCVAAQDFWSGHQDRALELLTDSARWASKPAQYALGIMYFNGDRVAANKPLGLAWLALAAERHDPQYEPVFVSAYAQATPAERAQANTLWKTMTPIYGDDVAATRAKLRFDREIKPIRDAAFWGGRAYVAGASMGTFSEDPMSGDGGMSSAFAVEHGIDATAAQFFHGWKENVYVGNAELVPLEQAVGRPVAPPNP